MWMFVEEESCVCCVHILEDWKILLFMLVTFPQVHTAKIFHSIHYMLSLCDELRNKTIFLIFSIYLNSFPYVELTEGCIARSPSRPRPASPHLSKTAWWKRLLESLTGLRVLGEIAEYSELDLLEVCREESVDYGSFPEVRRMWLCLWPRLSGPSRSRLCSG